MTQRVSNRDIHPIRLLMVFFGVFFITAVILFLVDFVPEAPQQEESVAAETASEETPVEMPQYVEAPTRVVIPSIGVDTKIENPTSTAITDLDNALLNGAVRYPGSARLGERSTMFLFGHQSGLPVVQNKAFKAFNGLQKLSAGDVIKVYSDNTLYEYTVQSVSLVQASDALIPLKENSQNLILSTCNSFGEPGERYVVEAFYSTHSIL
ncbi:MAG: sortase [Patescibacteria group bacterium UBA2163]